MRASRFSYERPQLPRSSNLRRILLAGLVLGTLASTARAGVEVRVVTTDHASKPPARTEGVLVAADGHLAMDLARGPDGAAGKNTTVFQGETQHFVVIDHQEKAYSVMNEEAVDTIAAELEFAMRELDEKMAGLPPEQRKILQSALAGDAREQLPTRVQKTTEVATKAGFSTRKFEIRRGEELVREVWVADWEKIPEGKEMKSALEGMEGFFLRLQEIFESVQAGSLGGTRLFDMGDNPFQDLSEMNGFPVLTRNFEDGKLVSQTEVESIRTVETDPATFQPPAGYKERTMGGGR